MWVEKKQRIPLLFPIIEITMNDIAQETKDNSQFVLLFITLYILKYWGNTDLFIIERTGVSGTEVFF